MNRRESLKLIAAAPVAAGFSWTSRDVEQAQAARQAARQANPHAEPQFFTPHEYETVHALVDLIIPADDRSGSATDAGVPDFMDFMMIDRPVLQTPMRGGLGWLDHQCRKRFGQPLIGCTEAQQHAVLDDIAWPEQAPPEMRPGVAFFNSFRDLTASGFWSSKVGVDDLRYMGNTVVPEWKGCPDEVLQRLGVSYDE